MTARADRILLSVLRTVSHAGSDLDDAALLNQFLLDRDPAAFEAVVTRHGPMVLRLCQRLLADAHDAEDAFQATFLVFLRKAASIRPASALAAWLHRVAYHVALGSRAARRRRREGAAPDLPAPDPRPDPLSELTAREVLQILDEEVQRLPTVYRSPVVLCCLEGLSQEEAARQLGWTSGSVKGRLERGRKRLRQRLARARTRSAGCSGTRRSFSQCRRQPCEKPGSFNHQSSRIVWNEQCRWKLRRLGRSGSPGRRSRQTAAGIQGDDWTGLAAGFVVRRSGRGHVGIPGPSGRTSENQAG